MIPVVFLTALLAASCATAPCLGFEAEKTEEGYSLLYPGVEYRFILSSEPRPLRAHVVRVDLGAGGLALRTPAGPDPDGEGPAEASLQEPLRLARAAGARVLINASAFTVAGYAEGKRPPVYLRGRGVDIAGLAVDSGRIVSPSSPRYASIFVEAGGQLAIAERGEEPEDGVGIMEAAAGFATLLSKGAVVEEQREVPEPRTAVGLDTEGRVILFVAEGRRRGSSEGLTLWELANWMAQLGCVDALNLDGGGSSVLVIRLPAGGYRILTRPAAGIGPFRRQRPLPNALVIADSE